MGLTIWSIRAARRCTGEAESHAPEESWRQDRDGGRPAWRPAGEGPGPCAQRGRRTSALILEAAEAVFAELGFKGATTAAIAARAGLPKANVHYYFPSKDDLYRAVMARVLDPWLAAAASLRRQRRSARMR